MPPAPSGALSHRHAGHGVASAARSRHRPALSSLLSVANIRLLRLPRPLRQSQPAGARPLHEPAGICPDCAPRSRYRYRKTGPPSAHRPQPSVLASCCPRALRGGSNASSRCDPHAPAPASGECRCAGCRHRSAATLPSRLRPLASLFWPAGAHGPAQHRQPPRAHRQSCCAASHCSAVQRFPAPAGDIPDLRATRPCADEFCPPAPAWQAIRPYQTAAPAGRPRAPCPRAQRLRRGARSAR